MERDKHIDVRLFNIFIEKKIYLTYPEKFSPQEQHDDLDETALFKIAPKVNQKKREKKLQGA